MFNIVMAGTVVMVSWEYPRTQTPQDTYIVYVQFLCISYASIKLEKFNAKNEEASRSFPVNEQLVFHSTRPFERSYEIYFRTVYFHGRWGNHVSIYPLISVSFIKRRL